MWGSRLKRRWPLRLIRAGSILGMLVAIGASGALAWSGPGHRLVGLVAWERMDAEARSEAARILRQHERFDYDVVEPLEGENGCEHPMRGVLDVSVHEADGTGFDASIDYFPNDGACDDIAVITVDGHDVTTDVSS